MTHPGSTADDQVTLVETLPQVAMLLGGVPTMTVLVMAAIRYVAGGTL